MLAWSQERFGEIGRRRYETLPMTALGELAADPRRVGSRSHPDLGSDIRSFHLRHSRLRARTSRGVVTCPRHLVIYRVLPADTVEIGRILHEAMDIERHLPSEYRSTDSDDDEFR